jgi:hypothetical protein
MRKKIMKNTVGVIILFLFTSFLIYILKPYLQSSLNLTNKDSLFIVLLCLLSFSVGGVTVFITNIIEKNSQKKN